MVAVCGCRCRLRHFDCRPWDRLPEGHSAEYRLGDGAGHSAGNFVGRGDRLARVVAGLCVSLRLRHRTAYGDCIGADYEDAGLHDDRAPGGTGPGRTGAGDSGFAGAGANCSAVGAVCCLLVLVSGRTADIPQAHRLGRSSTPVPHGKTQKSTLRMRLYIRRVLSICQIRKKSATFSMASPDCRRGNI